MALSIYECGETVVSLSVEGPPPVTDDDNATPAAPMNVLNTMFSTRFRMTFIAPVASRTLPRRTALWALVRIGDTMRASSSGAKAATTPLVTAASSVVNAPRPYATYTPRGASAAARTAIGTNTRSA